MLEAGRHRFAEALELIAEELQDGRPVLAFNLSGTWDWELVIGYDPAEGRLFYQNWKPGLVISATDWERRRVWRVLALRGYDPKWGQRTLELDGVADMVVRARHPMIEGGCGALGAKAENAVGLAAYRLWAERVLLPEHHGDLAKGRRLAWWVAHRKLGVDFLRGLASGHDAATTKQLTLAADILQRELDDALLPLLDSAPPSDGEENRRRQREAEVKKKQSLLMNRAELIQRELVKALEPVAFRHFGLLGESAQIIAFEFDGVYNPARVALINKMLLSTDARVRSLAALAAGRARNERLATELHRALLDRDEQLAHCALWALKRMRPKGFAGMLWEAYERSAMTREHDGAPDQLKRQLVFAAADLADARAQELLRAAFQAKGHDDVATARWAAEALARIDGNKAVNTLIDGLAAKNPVVVLASIGGLRYLHSTRACVQFEQLTQSPDRAVREAAREALTVLGG